MITRFTLIAAAGSLCAAALAAEQATSPASTPGTGSIRGRLSAPEGRQLPETVVFLVASDPARTFPPPAQHATFTQKEGKFIPQFQVIPVGQSVEFHNDEPTPLEHNVFSRSPAKQFDLGLCGPSAPAKPVLFDKPGEVAIFCSVHRYMDATIYVTPTPFFAIADKDGNFEIKDVPPGDFTIKTWQRRKRLNDASEAVTVAAGQQAAKDLALTR